jgi:hypothetical protein
MTCAFETREAVVHGDLTFVEVDGALLEPANLAAVYPGSQFQQEQGRKPVPKPQNMRAAQRAP